MKWFWSLPNFGILCAGTDEGVQCGKAAANWTQSHTFEVETSTVPDSANSPWAVFRASHNARLVSYALNGAADLRGSAPEHIRRARDIQFVVKSKGGRSYCLVGKRTIDCSGDITINSADSRSFKEATLTSDITYAFIKSDSMSDSACVTTADQKLHCWKGAEQSPSHEGIYLGNWPIKGMHAVGFNTTEVCLQQKGGGPVKKIKARK